MDVPKSFIIYVYINCGKPPRAFRRIFTILDSLTLSLYVVCVVLSIQFN